MSSVILVSPDKIVIGIEKFDNMTDTTANDPYFALVHRLGYTLGVSCEVELNTTWADGNGYIEYSPGQIGNRVLRTSTSHDDMLDAVLDPADLQRQEDYFAFCPERRPNNLPRGKHVSSL